MLPSRYHGWKSRLFHLSHSPAFLLRLTIGILLSGFLVACAIIAIKPQGPANSRSARFQKRLAAMDSSSESGPRLLVGWLIDLTTPSPFHPHSKKLKEDPMAGMSDAGGPDLAEIFQKLVTDAATRKLFDDFIIIRLGADETKQKQARQRLEIAANSATPPPFANEFLASLLAFEGNSEGAITALQKEAIFPDAKRARRVAFKTASERKDLPALRAMLAVQAYRDDAFSSDLHRVAILMGDWKLEAISFFRSQTESLHVSELVFTLLAGALWYVVFLRFGERGPWQWVGPLPALLAGVISIWPTFFLVHWQEIHFGPEENGEALHDLVSFVTGVGLREESSKLLLFALFLPWLLRQKSRAKALLTGAFVGLGFALEENLSYYQGSGVSVEPVARLLTANFFHAAATGLTGFALYEMARTRFGKAEQFIATFVAIVVVHGVYDWVLTSGSNMQTLGNLGIFSVIILALLARQFFDTIESCVQPRRGAVSLLSQFLTGVSLLISAGFIMAAIHGGTMQAVSRVGMEAISLVPVTVFYARKFAHL